MKNIMIRQFLGIVAATVNTASWLITLLCWTWRIAGMHLVARHSAVGKIVLTVETWQRIVPWRVGPSEQVWLHFMTKRERTEMMFHAVVGVSGTRWDDSNVCSDRNEEKGKKKVTMPQHTSLSDVNLCWTIFKIFLVCGFVFLWFWPESLFSVWDIFLGFFLFVVVVLTILLYCTFRGIGLLAFCIFLRVD
jgi:hypothetical protein